MVRRVSITIAAWFLAVTGVFAQTFPYKARVVKNETYVRSGAGEAFYPTQVLKKGAVVTVRRRDPGGWVMIDPPEGSFSWIPAKYVRQQTAGAGEVTEDNVVVFVGSSFGEETHVWQRRLSSGDSVRILGRQQIDTLSGPREMLKIEPPIREYRWIQGSDVVPVDEVQREQHDRDPYKVPSALAVREEPENSTGWQQPDSQEERASSTPVYSPSRRLQRLKQIRAEQRKLQEIDARFRAMILADPENWELQEIEREYRELQNTATYKPVVGQIDLRYPAIRRYQQRKAQLEELKKLTSETEKRDAELLARQYQLPGMVPFAEVSGGTPGANVLPGGSFVAAPQGVTDSSFAVTPSLEIPSVASPSGLVMQGSDQQGFSEIAGSDPFLQLSTENSGGTASPVSSSGDVTGLLTQGRTTHGPSIPAQSRYVGAGVLVRNTGDSQHPYVLTTRSGKILAYVAATGNVDLESWVGKAVGLQGERSYDQKLRGDQIKVSRLEPVRLR